MAGPFRSADRAGRHLFSPHLSFPSFGSRGARTVENERDDVNTSVICFVFFVVSVGCFAAAAVI